MESVDFISGVDLPGELFDPPEWEVVQVDECRLCGNLVTATVGLCRLCLDRLPRVGGCGLVLAVVLSQDLDHLISCFDCRDYLDCIGELVRVASMESAGVEGRSSCLRS